MILGSDELEELEIAEEVLPLEDDKPRKESKNNHKNVEVRRKIEEFLELRRMKGDYAFEEDFS